MPILAQKLPPFNIFDHLNSLTLDSGTQSRTEASYQCPVCGADNFKVNLKTWKYQTYGCDCMETAAGRQRVIDAIAPREEWVKPPRPQQTRHWEYRDANNKPLIRVNRTDSGDGKRKISQQPLVAGQKPAQLQGQVRPYRYADCVAAQQRGEMVFWVEGEPSADALWQLGIPATTTIRGSGGYSPDQYQNLFNPELLVIAPDRDEVGIKYGEAIAADYQGAAWMYADPPSHLWNQLPKNGGFDVGDWIESGATKAQILGAIESRRQAALPMAAQTASGQQLGFASSPDDGLTYTFFDKDGDVKITHIGEHLAAISHVNNPEGRDAQILVELKTQHRGLIKVALPRKMIYGDLTPLLGELGALGYRFGLDYRKLLHRYLHDELGTGLTTSKTVTEATGWYDGNFLLQDQTIGDQDLHWRDPVPPKNPNLACVGSLEGWQASIGEYMAGNSRLTLAVGAALAAPLLEPLDLESGAIHLVGPSSLGKTTALTVAASVTGAAKPQSWNSTANGLEATAEAHNDLLLTLDEMGQCSPAEAAKTAYMLANGTGKRRMSKDTAARKTKTWRSLVLSSGEKTLSEVLQDGKIKVKGGQEARFPSVPAKPAGGQYGLFETIHDYSRPAEFAEALASASAENRGTPLIAFLENLVPVAKNPDWVRQAKNRVQAIARTLADGFPDTDGVVARVARRFAGVQFALELAQAWEITTLPASQPEEAIAVCFQDWLTTRGGAGSIEIKAALA